MASILLLILIVSAAVLAALGVRELLRRKLSPTSIAHAEKVVPILLGTVGGLYGLVAGFTLSNSWTDFKSLQTSITTEVNALSDLALFAESLPPHVRDELIDGIENYLETVRRRELIRLAEGRGSQETTVALKNLWRVLGEYHPETYWETSSRQLAFARITEVSEQRRSRIVNSRASLPGIMWAILLGGGVVVASGAIVVSLQYRRLAGVFLGALTAILTLVLIVIYVLDQPFRYGLGVETGEYVVLAEMLRNGNL
jgi:hypothetical protein